MQEKNTAPISAALSTPVRYLKGVGPKKSEALARLGIQTVEDLIYFLPRRYEDRSTFTPIKDLRPGEPQTTAGEIVTVTSRLSRAGASIFSAALTDGTGFIHAVWFNQPYLKDYLRKGQRVVLYGRVERYDRTQFVQPEYELLKGGEADSIHVGRIVPIK